jgi:hypothetical protein
VPVGHTANAIRLTVRLGRSQTLSPATLTLASDSRWQRLGHRPDRVLSERLPRPRASLNVTLQTDLQTDPCDPARRMLSSVAGRDLDVSCGRKLLPNARPSALYAA